MQKIQKRLFYWIIFLITCSICIATVMPAFASSDFEVTIPDSSGVPGQIVSIPIQLSSSGNVTGLQFDLNYDSQIMTCIGINNGSLTSAFSISQNQVAPGQQRVVLYSHDMRGIDSGNGSIAIVNFQVAATATENQISPMTLNGVILPNHTSQTSDVPKAVESKAVFKVLSSGAVHPQMSTEPNKTNTSTSPISNAITSDGTNQTLAIQPTLEQNLYPGELKDVQNHWAKSYINQLVAKKVFSGYADGNFLPDNKITRAEFARAIAGALHLSIQSDAKLSFKDGDGIADWARPYIAAAVKAGIISGYSDNTFGASKNITRAEIAAMVVRATHRTLVEKPQLAFADSISIPEWSKPYVKVAADTGLITGKPGNTFMANDNATRAEAATLIVKLLNIMGM